MRKSGAKAGFVISDNGNYIMDTDFSDVAAFVLCVCEDDVKVIEK